MNKRSAFTLAELMLALAITAILVILLANVVSAALGAWQQGRNRLDTFSNARQLIGRIADEVTAAVAATDRMEFVENSSEVAGAVDAVARKHENLFFVAPYPNSGAGDLCVIAYRHNASTRQLERAFMDSATAWAVTPGNRYKVAASSALVWRPIADGVIEFEIRSFSQDDLDNNVRDEDVAASWDSRPGQNVVMEGKTPRRVVLRLVVVDDRTLARIDTLSQEVVERGAREFSADFSLPAR